MNTEKLSVFALRAMHTHDKQSLCSEMSRDYFELRKTTRKKNSFAHANLMRSFSYTNIHIIRILCDVQTTTESPNKRRPNNAVQLVQPYFSYFEHRVSNNPNTNVVYKCLTHKNNACMQTIRSNDVFRHSEVRRCLSMSIRIRATQTHTQPNRQKKKRRAISRHRSILILAQHSSVK